MHRLRACLLALVVLPLAGWEPLWRMDPDVADGNRAYQDGRYDDALAAYDRAEDSGVDRSSLDYDRGTAVLGKATTAPSPEAGAPLYAEADALLENATRSRDPRVKARAHYNRGNLRMTAKQLDAAIGEYKNALRADPTLESARSNLELALRQREKQRQQQRQQQGGQGQQGQQGQQPPPQPGQGGQGQQGQQGQGQGQQGQPQQGQPQQPQPGQQGQQQPQQGQPGQSGQAQGQPQRRIPQAQWPRDDTESDTPDASPGTKLDQLEDMSRQLRRSRIRDGGGGGGGEPAKDW